MRPFALTFILATSAFLVACQPDTGPIGPIHDDALRYPRITISDPSLQEKLGFGEPIVSHTADGLMQVTVPVRARDVAELHVEYRVIWFDAAGLEVPPQLSWRYLRLEPRQPIQFTVNATSQEAKDYNVQFRWAQR